MDIKNAVFSPEIKSLITSTNPLSVSEKKEILTKFKVDNAINGHAGSFLQSKSLEAALKVEIGSSKNILMLYAGVGVMGLVLQGLKNKAEITCVEQDSNLIAVGKRLLPEANWIQADPYSFKQSNPDVNYDVVISTPTTEFSGNGYNYEHTLMNSLKTLTQRIIHFIPNSGLILFVRKQSREYHAFNTN